MRSFFVLSLSLLAFSSACGHPPVPAQDIAKTESSLRGAEEAGAAKVPQAALHVKMARDQLALAQRLIADDEMGRAQEALRRAELDAELAVALARENETRRAAAVQVEETSELRTGAP